MASRKTINALKAIDKGIRNCQEKIKYLENQRAVVMERDAQGK
jgi:hypothetical protein